MALAERANYRTQELQASTRNLASLCGVDAHTVTRAITDMTMAGLIERTKRGDGLRPSRYRFTVPTVGNGTTAYIGDELVDNTATVGNGATADRGTVERDRGTLEPRPWEMAAATVGNATTKQGYISKSFREDRDGSEAERPADDPEWRSGLAAARAAMDAEPPPPPPAPDREPPAPGWDVGLAAARAGLNGKSRVIGGT
jgi:hypothetical protein